jgi:hypothetical protein
MVMTFGVSYSKNALQQPGSRTELEAEEEAAGAGGECIGPEQDMPPPIPPPFSIVRGRRSTMALNCNEIVSAHFQQHTFSFSWSIKQITGD